ncbi:hypothetical protein PSP6_80102 [Paraburkholderia tropica]|nr:hypothetical protein [Paraburkholderia tropica]CAG9238508.1 hypothetical protein PSP6_80102 [Paraburkholderia tropica]
MSVRMLVVFEFDVQVIVMTNQAVRADEEVDDNPLLATARCRHGSKPH